MLLNKKPIFIGIAGGSASGKTSIAKIILKEFETTSSVSILREDDYYKDQSHMPFEQRLLTNYDHPFAFDHDLLLSHLNDLLNGKSIEKPTYDYINHTRSKIFETIKHTDVIILEGLFVLENKDVRDMLDMKIFVQTEADIRFIRRLLRDVKERKRSIDSIIEQYTKTVRVMHEEFIEPSKKYADIIIPEGSSNNVAIDLLITKIKSIIN